MWNSAMRFSTSNRSRSNPMIMWACGDCGNTDLPAATTLHAASVSPLSRRFIQVCTRAMRNASGDGCVPCVCVVGLQLIIVALKGSVILHLYAEEDCLLQDITCMVNSQSALKMHGQQASRCF